MTISNDRFDRIFSRINRLEAKLEDLDPITKYKKIQEFKIE